jgi:hypothetical protein
LLAGFAPLLEYEGAQDPPGWPLLPLADGTGLVVVLGRSLGSEANALLSLEFTRSSGAGRLGLEVADEDPGARLRWAVVGADHVDAAFVRSEVPELLELGNFEFQGGPVLAGDLLMVQAREYAGQIRAWVLAFDRRDGNLQWKRLIATGADRVPAGRFTSSARRVASQPPLSLVVDGQPRLFSGTHLGAGGLLDALTGEILWTVKNRRRDPREPGSSGDRPTFSTSDARGPASPRRWTLTAPISSASFDPGAFDSGVAGGHCSPARRNLLEASSARGDPRRSWSSRAPRGARGRIPTRRA